ncbi:MAG: PAS domain S-box protein [Sandaracinaceae bacterium]|nr:PAS domain S-box protein [Sandaracinaceae bacterium]
MTNSRTILVVYEDEEGERLLGGVLRDAEFTLQKAGSREELVAIAAKNPPALVILELTLNDKGFETLTALRKVPVMLDIPVIVLTRTDTDEAAARAFELGADDLLRKPLRPSELLARIRTHMRSREYLEELARKEHDAHVMLEVTQALASTLDFRDILYTVVRRIADVVRVERVSIVLAPEEDDVGFVVAASDDEQVNNLRLDLSKYPEIQQVLRTRQPLTIEDVATHPVLDGVRADVSSVTLSALTLLPIVWEEKAIGVLFLRAAARRGALLEREIDFCRIVANATGVALRNARVMQSLRDHTQQVTFARFEAERRLRSLKRYADYFASAADGLAAVDAEGRLLFVNPRALTLIGYDEQELLGKKMRSLVESTDSEHAREIYEGFAHGHFPLGVDLRVRRKDGVTRTFAFSFSTLVDGEGAVLLSFRDVTEERATATELVKTKEFLESLIDASVDPIVASDMTGTIILYNKGAERVYGWTREEVVGKMHVRMLYPGDGAREVMRMIKSGQHGGAGRLDNVRIDAINRVGERIPITLSAAMIYENGKAIATFGIFTDLREKMRVEERLAQAQQKLALSEKQVYIAELAGTAAHELNQPLTSVLAYAEMLKRKIQPGRPERAYAETIVSEAERMADIVRKIGKITKYETKTYVGSQRILDLDKASDVAGEVKNRE